MMLSIRSCLFLAAAGALAGTAQAQSLTANAGSANITAGDRAAEFRAGLDDEGNVQSRVHFEQAFTGWYQLRAIAAFRQPDGEDWDYSGMTLENWFQWSEESSDNTGFNGGLRLAYTFTPDGAPDEFAARLTLTDRFAGNWEWRANLIAATETGDQRADGAELESRLQLTRALPAGWMDTTGMRFGAELFSEYGTTEDLPGLDQQAHQFGPVFKAEWDNGIYLQTAVRAGLTSGSDDFMGKIFVGREF